MIDAFNQNLNLTLSELSRRSGWTVKEIKDLLMGDYLIDDRLKNGAGEFSGELLRFGLDWENNYTPNEYPTWDSILEKLL